MRGPDLNSLGIFQIPHAVSVTAIQFSHLPVQVWDRPKNHGAFTCSSQTTVWQALVVCGHWPCSCTFLCRGNSPQVPKIRTDDLQTWESLIWALREFSEYLMEVSVTAIQFSHLPLQVWESAENPWTFHLQVTNYRLAGSCGFWTLALATSLRMFLHFALWEKLCTCSQNPASDTWWV